MGNLNLYLVINVAESLFKEKQSFLHKGIKSNSNETSKFSKPFSPLKAELLLVFNVLLQLPLPHFFSFMQFAFSPFSFSEFVVLKVTEISGVISKPAWTQQAGESCTPIFIYYHFSFAFSVVFVFFLYSKKLMLCVSYK